jgi:hypothetical protein
VGTEQLVNVNWSADEVNEVPPAVVTVISTCPDASAGDVAVIDVSEFTLNVEAATVPNITAEAAVSPVPVMVTEVPPLVELVLGEMRVTVGAGAVYVNSSPATAGEVPAIVLTSTSTTPDASAGDVAVIDVSEFTLKVEPATVPNITDDAAVRPVPVIITEVPPAVGPRFGLTASTVGGEATPDPKVNDTLALAPVGPSTVTETVPIPAGVVAVSSVEETTVTFVALPAAPKETPSPDTKSDPEIVTCVPPAAGPELGEIEVMDGPGAGGGGGENGITAFEIVESGELATAFDATTIKE